MKEKLLGLLKEQFTEIDFEASDSLVDDDILDSLTMIGVISAISTEFGVVLPYEEIVPENFNSLDAMVAMLENYI